MSAWLASTLFALVVGALADTIGFSPLFAVLAVFDLLGALVICTVLQNKPALEVAQPHAAHHDAVGLPLDVPLLRLRWRRKHITIPHRIINV